MVVPRKAVAQDSFFRHLELLVIVALVVSVHLDVVAAAPSKRLEPLIVDLPS